jgi:hypothetical protein
MVSPHGTESSRGWKEDISAPATLMRLAAGAGREAQERTSIVQRAVKYSGCALFEDSGELLAYRPEIYESALPGRIPDRIPLPPPIARSFSCRPALRSEIEAHRHV